MTVKIGKSPLIPDWSLVRAPASILVLILAAISAGSARAGTEEGSLRPLRIRLQLARGPYYVGQGIMLTVGVIAESDRPRIDPPQVAGAETWPIETDVTPLTASGIGSAVAQENLFIARFRLVPQRVGTLAIPSVRVEADGRTGGSRPVALDVQAPPIAGRSGTFLGGIGRLDVDAEAEPTTLRVGQTLEYRVRIDGPAAWGSTTRPDLGRFDRVPLGLRIEPLPDEFVREPPSRTFGYRIRPTRPGESTLPALLISAFDPRLGAYQTKATAGVPIRAVAVPEFDPDSIDYRPPPDHRISMTDWGLLFGVAAIPAGLIAAAGWWFLQRRRARLRPQPIQADSAAARRFITRAGREFDDLPADPVETAERITAALVYYLELGLGRPPGALTPAEGGRGVADLTGSTELGDRSERLLAACDRSLYGIDGDPIPDRDEARRLFRDLGSC